MIAVDTNVLVRLVTADDEGQTAAARQLIETSGIFVPKSVLLETEWVLRYTYELDRVVIAETFGKLLGLQHLVAEDLQAVVRALEWYQRGLDFADALHLASSQAASELATFDGRFARSARRAGCRPVVRVILGTEE